MDFSHRTGNSFRVVSVCLSRLKQYGIRDVAILAIAACIFAVNNVFIKPGVTEGAFKPFLNYYANDVLGGIAFLAYSNLIITMVKPSLRIRRLVTILAFIACCGVFWEYVSPLFIKPSVSDPWDIVAYCSGGLLYWLTLKIGKQEEIIKTRY